MVVIVSFKKHTCHCEISFLLGLNEDYFDSAQMQSKTLESSSFMQSLDYWFYDLPTHSLPEKLHHEVKRFVVMAPLILLCNKNPSLGI